MSREQEAREVIRVGSGARVGYPARALEPPPRTARLLHTCAAFLRFSGPERGPGTRALGTAGHAGVRDSRTEPSQIPCEGRGTELHNLILLNDDDAVVNYYPCCSPGF